jgi:ATP-dependent DNA helicase RecG
MERIRGQGGVNDWSINIVPEATLDNLDSKAITKARTDYLKTNPNKQEEVESWDDITFLNKVGITYNGQITNTTLLLLGNEDAQYLLLPSAPQITRILKDSKGVERDYHHYFIPFLLTREEVINKIRNIKYRYMTGSSSIPTEVDTYDPYSIREALNNCIAHQDYTLGRRIIIVENENSLIFSNAGAFIPETIENVLNKNAPSDEYRNEFLTKAMVKL